MRVEPLLGVHEAVSVGSARERIEPIATTGQLIYEIGDRIDRGRRRVDDFRRMGRSRTSRLVFV